MSFTADQIVDRRRMRRKLSFGRVVAFVAGALAIIAAAGLLAAGGRLPGMVTPQIARLSIEGFITDNQAQLDLIDDLAEADGVKGVIVAIDSTGGAGAGGEALYDALRRLAAKKPVVAEMRTVAASAAYMAAIATDHIVARRSTLTGSIGAIFQYPEVSGLLDHLGVKVEDIASGPLKAQPSPFKPTTPEARAVIESVVGDIHAWFVDIVAERRGLARPDALTLADGRIFTGQQALAVNLVDEIGGEREALAWLKSKGVDDTLPVRDWKPSSSEGGFLSASAIALLIGRELGLTRDLPTAAFEYFIPERLKLDGLVSVWQASPGGPDAGARGARQ